MIPKEKATELVNRFASFTDMRDTRGFVNHDIWIRRNVDCALIVVNEVILSSMVTEEGNKYWKEVKLEIEKL